MIISAILDRFAHAFEVSTVMPFALAEVFASESITSDGREVKLLTT